MPHRKRVAARDLKYTPPEPDAAATSQPGAHPLTAEQEAHWREDIAADRWGATPRWSSQSVASLFATLDAARAGVLPGMAPSDDEVMARLSGDNPRSRQHREQAMGPAGMGYSGWTCIPLIDVVASGARAALLAASRPPEGAVPVFGMQTQEGAK